METQAILGDFIFSADSTRFNEIKYTASQRLSTSSPFGQPNRHHSLGLGDVTVELPCKIYPCLYGDASALDLINEMMASGQSYALIDIGGNVSGNWFVVSVPHTFRHLDENGVAREIELSISLVRDWYD